MIGFLSARESPRPAAILRAALGLVLFCEAAVRWPDAIELYSSAGRPMPVFPASAFEPRAPGPATTVLLHTALVWSLVSVAIGWNTRLSLLIAAALATWLGLLDLPGTYKKYTAISLHLLLLLSLTNSGGAWSVDAWLRRRARQPAADSPVWPRRMVQLFLCSVYLGAAITKLRLPEFVSGEPLEFWLLGDDFGGRSAARWIVEYPSLLGAASLLAVLLELTFPVLVWAPKLRRTMVVIAAAFHLTLAATMHLGRFSWVMLTGLSSFLTVDDLAAIRGWLGRPRFVEAAETANSCDLRAEVCRFLIWSAATALVLGIGLTVQKSFDWYGVLGPHRPSPRTEVPKSLALEMLDASPPPYSDFIHRLEAGQRIRNGRAFGGRNEFRRGMVVQAVARFLQPHPAFRVDWQLIGPDGQQAARLTRPIDASAARAFAGFDLSDDAPAGRYRIILQIEGYDAAEETIEVLDH